MKKIDPSRVKQRETYIQRYGREGYAEAGRKGALKRWDEYRKLKEEQDGKNNNNN